MEFTRLLDTLGRSSAQAVSTLGHGSDAAEKLKQYLYIETPIEKDFREALTSSPPSSFILFLCGSSGDGKSEILKRYYEDYQDKFVFHLDATHSFKPDQNAIEALDHVFDNHKDAGKPLIIGINVGMLFNYSSTGSERHAEIKIAINAFTQNGRSSASFMFLNFENYPKFNLDAGTIGSAFISDLLERVVCQTDRNPLYVSYLSTCQKSPSRICHNFRLLQEVTVRQCIVRILLNTRLRFDQFLSARTLLDFIHHLICGPGFLFDNLFVKGQNELVNMLSHFDPCSIRTQKIDQFLVQRSLEVNEPDFSDFRKVLEQELMLVGVTPGGWLRAFFVLQGLSIGNDYHLEFKEDYQRGLYDRYIDVWNLHNQFDGSIEGRQELRMFYREQLVAALLRFGNRLAPELTERKQVFLSERNGIVISAKADVRPDFKCIITSQASSIHHFHICLKVEDQPLKPFPINVSFLELVLKINDGYRPNKHDKNTVVILEEIIEEICKVSRSSKTLFFSKAGKHASLTHEEDDGEFVVGEA